MQEAAVLGLLLLPLLLAADVAVAVADAVADARLRQLKQVVSGYQQYNTCRLQRTTLSHPSDSCQDLGTKLWFVCPTFGGDLARASEHADQCLCLYSRLS